jgi:tetratricopeptide (TPR) repeat protein
MKAFLAAVSTTLCLAGSGSLPVHAEAPAPCPHDAAYAEAQDLYGHMQYEAALRAAGRVRRDAGCEATFVQAGQLMVRIYVFELKDYEKGIAAAQDVLEADPAQGGLWFDQGYAAYHLGRYSQATRSFREFLWKMEQGVLGNARELEKYAYAFLADATFRMATQPGAAGPTPEARQLTQDAIAAQQEYLDYCEENDCDPEMQERVKQRLHELRTPAR